MSQQINLYNPALAPRVDLFSGRYILVGLSGLLAVLLLAWGFAGFEASRVAAEERALGVRLSGVQADVARLAQEVAGRKPDAALERELADLEALLAARNQVMATLGSGALGDTRGVSEYFRAFARQRAEGVWLTGFVIGGAGDDIVIEGRTTDAQMLPGYLNRLRRETSLRGSAFESVRISQPPARAAVDGRAAAPPEYLEFRLASARPAAADPGAEPRR